MIKVNVDGIKQITKSIGYVIWSGIKVTVPVILAGMTVANVQTDNQRVCVMGNAQYSDAVRMIMSSDMFSSDKSKVVSMLPQGQDSQFYLAVIEIAKSDMFSSNKVQSISSMIKTLPKQEEN